MIDAAGILYDGAVKKLEWIRNIVQVEPKFRDIIKKSLIVKEHENIEELQTNAYPLFLKEF